VPWAIVNVAQLLFTFVWCAVWISAASVLAIVDIPAAFYAIPVNLRFVAKEQLKWVPFIGLFIWVTGMIFVDRSRRAKAVASLEKAAARIRAGANIIAYPEGTRSSDGRILPFKKGPSHDVRMKVGKPIPTAGLTADDRDRLIRDVRSALIGLHREIGGAGGVDVDIAAAGVEGLAAS
jgi:1-acyl-sn-glycerol-3-phosphate acyltransferase